MASKGKKIVLASASPRRKEILSLTGLKFKALPSFFDESTINPALSPEKYVKRLAMGKAESAAAKNKNSIVIGADTIVICGPKKREKILGKPKDEKEAEEILNFCCGKMSCVLTAVAIIDTETKKTETILDSTKVKMRKYKCAEIKDYVKTEKPLEYAGAFAIQDRDWVESIDGSFFNVVGFPILAVIELLKKFGVIVAKKQREKISRLDKYIL